jgi:hypothetical protein
VRHILKTNQVRAVRVGHTHGPVDFAGSRDRYLDKNAYKGSAGRTSSAARGRVSRRIGGVEPDPYYRPYAPVQPSASSVESLHDSVLRCLISK